MNATIKTYHQRQTAVDRKICELLAKTIDSMLPDADSKIWHSHPVWFLDENPIVGYSKQKAGLRLMFWSGASFEGVGLPVLGAKFKDASIFYNAIAEVDVVLLKNWLAQARAIQWDYKNIVKRKGRLERLK